MIELYPGLTVEYMNDSCNIKEVGTIRDVLSIMVVMADGTFVFKRNIKRASIEDIEKK